MRRKGERPLVKHLSVWSDDHPVAQGIRSGDRWFTAWMHQYATPYPRLAQITGIPKDRFPAIEAGGPVSRAELEALARAWCVSVDDLIKSIGAGPATDEELVELGRMVEAVRMGHASAFTVDGPAGQVAIARVERMSHIETSKDVDRDNARGN